MIGRYRDLGIANTVTSAGKRKAACYLHLLAHPEIHQAIIDVELPAVERAVLGLQSRHRGNNVALSWGYVHLLTAVLPTVSRYLLFRSDQSVWYERLRQRARLLGLPPTVELTADDIRRLIVANGMDLSPIERAVRKTGKGCVVIDTSPTDWGARRLTNVLRTLQ